MARDYYVIKEQGQWKVKLERGRVISTHRKQSAAKRKAEKLGRKNNRGVTVNAAGGYTRYRKGPDEL
jgi:hypothetical protein